MAEGLLSVGLDVGTTTTQLIVSRLRIENQASAFTVPDMTITDRTILYESPIHFTPLLDETHVDGDGIRQIVAQEYENAHIRRDQVDTGAIIITRETSRKENARTVLSALSDYAGEFVVATAGPDLESVLAARGAGAVDHSACTGARVLHMDIGGGTSNLAWIEDGKIISTGCLNVGGRLLKFDGSGTVTYVSPVLKGLTGLHPSDHATEAEISRLAQLLTQALEMAAGLRAPTDLLTHLTTSEARCLPSRGSAPAGDGGEYTISFSGGVADCIETDLPPLQFGDMGPALGKAIRQSRLCQNYRLGRHTIRATVIGAGCHSAQLSGSTVFHRSVSFPLKDLPVIPISSQEQQSPDLPHLIQARCASQDTTAVLALPGYPSASYAQTTALAERLLQGLPAGPIYLAVEQDMAKALGQALALRTDPARPLLCLDRLRLPEGSYLDVTTPIGPALPVVIKTLILSH